MMKTKKDSRTGRYYYFGQSSPRFSDRRASRLRGKYGKLFQRKDPSSKISDQYLLSMTAVTNDGIEGHRSISYASKYDQTHCSCY